MAKILFVNPVIRAGEKPTHIPYGMAQLVAIALKAGHKVQVLDANAWRPSDDEIREAFGADAWDIIAVGGLITTYGFIKKAVRMARRICPRALVVAGGGFISPIPYEIMGFLPEVDIGVIGEGYVTLPEILDRVENDDSDWDSVKGIIYRTRDGGLRLNELRPIFEDVDSLPFPAWHLFPLAIYFKNSSILLSEEAMLSKKHLGVMASYGCPFSCKFCFHLGLSGELETTGEGADRRIEIKPTRKIRYHSPEYVTDLVGYARKRFGADFISFLDENFVMLAKKGTWFDRFERLWKKSGFVPRCAKRNTPHDPGSCKGIHWGATAHASLVSQDILKRFKRLGCAHLDYGFESFSDEILKSISKGATSSINKRALEMTVKAGIRPIPNQIIGFPEETFESIYKNVKAWKEFGIRSYPFFATPYPGSEWFFEYKKSILKQYGGDLDKFLLDLGDATKLTAVISKNFNSVELLGIRELMVDMDMDRLREYEKTRKRVDAHPAAGRKHE